MYMGRWPVCELWLFPFHAAQQVFGHFHLCAHSVVLRNLLGDD